MKKFFTLLGACILFMCSSYSVHAAETSTVSGATITQSTKKIVFIYTGTQEAYTNMMPSINELAKNTGVSLFVLGDDDNENTSSEESIYNVLLTYTADIQESTEILIGPKGTEALPALRKFLALQNKTVKHHIIVSSPANYWLYKNVLTKLASGISFAEVMLLEQDPFSSLNFLLQSKTINDFKQKFQINSYALVNSEERTAPWWLPLSKGIEQSIIQGVPPSLLSFLLLLPFILTFIAFTKQVIGIDTLSMLPTMILVLAFYVLGVRYGTVVLISVILLGATLRKIFKKFIHFYIPRTTLSISCAVLLILFILMAGSYGDFYFGIDTTNAQRALLSVIPMLLIAFQVDKLSYRIFSKEHGKKELMILFATYIEVVLAFSIARIDTLRFLLIAIPELTFIAFFLQYLLANYTGLRLMEIVRFKELLLQDLEE